MSANQARHRIRIARDDANLSVAGFWAARGLLDRAPAGGSPRHMQPASNKYLSVGRVGALAVSLGIGFALFNSATGTAFAEDSSTSTGADGSDGGQQASDNDKGNNGGNADNNGEADDDGDLGADNDDNDGDEDGEEADDDSGDLDENAGSDDELDGDDAGDDEEAQDPETEVVDVDDKVGSGGDYDGPGAAPQNPGAGAPVTTGGGDDKGTEPDPDADETGTTVVVDVPPPAVTPPPTEPEGVTPPETVEVAVAALEEESVEETDVITMAVSNVISPLLDTGNPIQSALTDTLLAWVRRLINHTFFNKTPVIESTSVTDLLGIKTITIVARDPNGDPLTYEVITPPTKGVLLPGLFAGTFTYIPNPLELLGGSYTETLKFRVRDDSEHLTGVYGTIQSYLEGLARRFGLAKADTIETGDITFTVGAGGIELGLPPLVTASGGKTYRVGSPAINPLTSVSISDLDSDYVSGATVTVKTDDLLFSKFVAGDKLTFTNTPEITGVYDETTGVLTLSGTATKAAYEAALESVTFTATEVIERFLGLGLVGRTLSIVVTDDTGASNSLFPARASVGVAAAAPGAAPTVTLSGTPIYALGGSGVQALPGVTIADSDSTVLSGAKVNVKSAALFGSFVSGDVLSFANTAQITGSYNTSTGVLTLSGNATVAQYKAALESVIFTGTSPGGLFNSLTDRTVSVTVTDDSARTSAGASLTIDVKAAGTVTGNPSIAVSGVAPTFVIGKDGVAVLPTVTLSDPNSTVLAGAKVSVRTSGLIANLVSGDLLSFTDTAEISGTFSNGVLTLTGNATLEQYKAALESIVFTATQNLTERKITVTVTDDSGLGSASATAAVKVANPARPSVSVSGSPTFILGKPAVGALPSVTITDSDSTTLSGAKVTVKTSGLFGAFVSGDKLNFANANGISGSFNTSTGVLTLSGNATVATYKAALESVTFSATDPGGFLGSLAERTLTVTVTDETNATSDSASSSVRLANPTPGAAPTVSVSGTPTFVLGKPGVAALSSVTITDSDSTLLSKATLTVKTSVLFGSFVSGDKLNFVDTAEIQGVYNTNTGVLTLSGNATVAQYKAALESVIFSATDGGGLLGALADRTLTVTVTDDTNATSGSESSSINIANPVTPTVSLSGTPTFVIGKPAVKLLPTVTINDSDSTTLSGAKVTVGVSVLGIMSSVSGDVLSFANQNGISIASNSGGVLTLTGNATVAQYKAALESITFSATQGGGLLGALADRAVLVTVTDETNKTSDEKSGSVNMANPVTPSVSLSGTPTFVLGYTNVIALPSVTISDSDSPTLSGAKVTVRKDDLLFPDYVSGDTLNFTNQNGISILSNTNGVLTLTGNATVAQYKAALESITFSATQVIDGLLGGTVSRKLTVTVTDEIGLTSDGQTGTLKVVRPSAPSVSVSGGTPTYTVGKTGVVVLPAVTITDDESTTLTKATVTVRKDDLLFPGFVSGDKLDFANANGITGVYNSSTGVLTLTGAASLAIYKTALQSVTFTATQVIDGLISGTVGRTVTFTVTDETNLTSDSASASVNVVRSAAPTVSVSGGSQTVVLGKPGVVVLPTITINDSDSTVLSGAKVKVTAAPALIPIYISGDTLSFTSQNGISIASNSGGVLTLTGNATVAQYKAALESITFSATVPGGLLNSMADRTFTVTVIDDSTATSNEASRSVSVAYPIAPTLSVSGATPTYLFGRSGVKLLPSVTITDSDSTVLSGAKVTVVGTFLGLPTSYVSGDALGFVNQNGISIASNANGVLTLTGTASLAQYKSALESITFSATQGGGALGAIVDRSVSITITDDTNRTSDEVSRTAKVDNPSQASVSVSGSTPQFYIGRPGVVALPSVTISDQDSTQIAGAKVSVKTDEFFSTVVSADSLNFNNSNAWGITGSYSNGVLTLTGTTSIANYQLALQSITFSTSTNTTDRKLTITVTGAEDQNAASDEASRAVKVANTVTPTVTLSGSTPTFYLTKSGPLVALPSVTISDPDSTVLSGATVSVKAGSTVVAGDVLSFTTQFGITAVSFTNGVLTLTGTTTLANYQTALQSITFAATANTTTRTVSVTVTSTDDVTPTSAVSTASINVSNPVAPTVTLSGTDAIQLFGPSSSIVLGGSAEAIIDEASINDPDSANLSKAVVMVRNGSSFQSGDTLAFTAANGITIQSNTNGVLTLTGNATKAAYKAALESITLRVTSGGGFLGAPVSRTLSVTLTDELGSTGATSTMTVNVTLF